jgi:hypothetical protein
MKKLTTELFGAEILNKNFYIIIIDQRKRERERIEMCSK